MLWTLATLIAVAQPLTPPSPPDSKPPAPAMHTIHITVELRDHTNAPVVDMCFGAHCRLEPPSDGVAATKGVYSHAATNALGQAVIDMTVPTDARRVVVPTMLNPDCFKDMVLERQKWWVEFIKANYMEPWYAVAISADKDDYELKIQCDPTFGVRGNAPQGTGEGFFGNVFVGNHFGLGGANRDTGEITIDGVSRNRTNYLFARGSKCNRWTVIEVKPPPIDRATSNVGTLEPLPETDGVPIEIKVRRRADLPDHSGTIHTSVTLVRADGGDVYSFIVGKRFEKFNLEDLAFSRHKGGGAPSVPQGTYYVAPGSPFAWAKCASGLYGAVRQGKQAELDAAGVPKIVVKAGVVNQSFTVDVVEAEAAIAKVVGYM